MTDIMDLAQSVSGFARDARHYLHSIPETGLKEFKTTEFIKSKLKDMGVQLSEYCTPTGVTAIIKGGKPGPVTAVRADIDALPLEEKTGVEYSSKNKGAAHSCGHDGHTAILLGLTKALTQIKDQIGGTVLLLFQPGEEGYKGAQRMIDAGALDNPRPDSIVALHGWPFLNCGEVGSMGGKYMASSDSFYVKFRGKGGHGCRPYMAVNPINAASAFINAVQGIVPNEIETREQSVVTVCSVHGGKASNIIPDDVDVSGTVRCLDPLVREQLEQKIGRVAENIAKCYMCESEYEYEKKLPPLINDAETVDALLASAERALGKEHIKQLPGPVMGAEDFAFMVNYIKKGAYLRLGIRDTDRQRVLHNAEFDFNDKAIPYGIAVFLQYILDEGRKQK